MAEAPNSEHEALKEARLRSRREILTRGAKLAFIAPVVLGMAQTNVVAAGSPSPDQASPSPKQASPSPSPSPKQASPSPSPKRTSPSPSPSPDDASPSPGQHGGRQLTATLTGAAEVPGPGDPDASGTAVLTFNPGQETVCYEFSNLSGLATITLAHIHGGAAGQFGSPVVDLFTPTTGTTATSGCVSADRDLIKQILKNPENYYVNIHTSEFKAGAIRGQLSH